MAYQQDELSRAAPARRRDQARGARAPLAPPAPVAGGQRFDVRATVRQSLATDGEAFRLAYTAPRPVPRRLLFICDVSGSMERYSRVLLSSLKVAVGASRKAEAFVFATRLTRLTKSLDGRDFERALEQARAAIPDWSGGTRIGGALSEFNRTYARRGFARGAIVLVVSDGWDRGDPAILAAEVRRLQLQARRLIWINPRPMEVDRQPLAIGMRAAMPYIDEFVPGHDPRAIAGMAQLIAGLEHRRGRIAGRSPARRRRRLRSPCICGACSRAALTAQPRPAAQYVCQTYSDLLVSRQLLRTGGIRRGAWQPVLHRLVDQHRDRLHGRRRRRDPRRDDPDLRRAHPRPGRDGHRGDGHGARQHRPVWSFRTSTSRQPASGGQRRRPASSSREEPDAHNPR